jgi:Bax protein
MAIMFYFSFYQSYATAEQAETKSTILQAAKNIVEVDETDDVPVPDFNTYKDVINKKKAFFSYLMPEIIRQNNMLRAERKLVLTIHERTFQANELIDSEQVLLNNLRLKYRVGQMLNNQDAATELIRRVDIIPPELILVQAANESGWGTSRFALKGYNFFGLWCFKKGCGFVPKQRNEGTVHEVAKFRNLSHSVKTYLHNLNRHFAYAQLREIRHQQRQANEPLTAQALVHGLKNYSERGTEYIEELLNMMRVNKKHMGL